MEAYDLLPDLDGKVDRTDSSLFGQGKLGAGTGWDFGDYDYLASPSHNHGRGVVAEG